MSAATVLSRWLGKQAGLVQADGALSRMVLYQVQAGRNAVQLDHWSFSEDAPCVPDEHAVEVLEAANSDAETVAGGLQRYVLRVYYGEQLEHAAQKSFTAGRRLVDDEFGGTEPPTNLGQRAQQMRHTEGLHALVIRGLGGMTDGLRRDLAEQRSHSIEVQRMLWQQEKELQELRRKDRQSELEFAEHQLRIDQQKTIYGIGMALLPAVLGKLTGQKIGAEQGPGEVALRALLADLDPEERMGIFEALKDGNKVRLIQLIKAYEEAEEHKQQTH